MAWTDGVTRATGDLILAADWNAYLGATGSLQGLKAHAHGGTTGEGSQSLGPLVLGDFTDAAAPAAPGAGKTRLYATAGRPAYRAGAAGADTPLADNVHATRHNAGGADALAIDAVTTTGSLRTLGTGAQQAAAGNHSHTPAAAVIGGNIQGSVPASTTHYHGPFAQVKSATENDVSLYAPRAGTAKNLRLRTTTAHPAGGGLVITLRKNEADTTMTLTVGSGDPASGYSDLTNQVTFAAGDRIALKLANANTGTSATVASWSIEYE